MDSETIENIVAIAVVSLVVLSAIGWWQGWFVYQEEQEQVFAVSMDDDPLLGNATAPVTIIEFSDLQCSSCALFHNDILPRLKTEYIDTGEVNLVLRDYPIEEIHPHASILAMAAQCAHDQDLYWEFVEVIFANQENISEEFLNATAVGLGMNLSQFNDCRFTGKYQEEVRQDKRDGLQSGGVTSTPTFFINGRRIIGVVRYEDFAKVIEEEKVLLGS